MSSLQTRLQNPDYKNWLKAGLCLIYTKEGLEDFADQESKIYHQNVINNVRRAGIPLTGNPVCSLRVTRNGLWNTCSHSYCQAFLNAVIGEGIDPSFPFNINVKNLANTDVHQWPNSPWELVKLFMNAGQQPAHTSPKDTDISGIGNFLRHCRVPRAHIGNIQYVKEVLDARNAIMHTTNMLVAGPVFKAYTNSMIDLLKDPNISCSMRAKNAVVDIQRVIGTDFQITLEDECKVMENLTAELQTLNRNIQQELTDLHQKVTETQNSAEEERTKIQDAIKMNEDEMKSVQATLDGLKRKVKDDDDLREKMEARIRTSENALEETQKTQKKLQSSHQQLEAGQERLENQNKELTNQITAMKIDQTYLSERQDNTESNMTDLKERVEEVERDVHKTKTDERAKLEEDGQELKQLLIEEYKRMYDELTLSPIYEGLNYNIDKVPFDELFTDNIILEEPKEEEKVKLPKQKHSSEKSKNRNVVIQGKAGVGKTTWCMHLLNTWCNLHNVEKSKVKTSDKSDKSDKITRDIGLEKSLSEFQYLFMVPLRYIETEVKTVKDAILATILKRFSKFENAFLYILKEHSKDVLIILEGADEYQHVLGDDGLNMCSVIETTRPWKLDDIASCTQKIDSVRDLKGLSRKGIEKLISNIIRQIRQKDNVADEAKKCLKDIRSCGFPGINSPLLLIISVICWCEDMLSLSLSQNIINMLKVIILRGEQKLQNSTVLEDYKRKAHSYEINLPTCFNDEKLCEYKQLLFIVGKLAYNGLTTNVKDGNQTVKTGLVFTTGQLEQYFQKEEEDIIYRFGLLSKSSVFASLIGPKKVSVSFHHSLFQELFMALWIVSTSKPVDHKEWLKCSTDIKVFENVIRFILELDPSFFCGSLKSYLFSLVPSVDERMKMFETNVNTNELRNIFQIETELICEILCNWLKYNSKSEYCKQLAVPQIQNGFDSQLLDLIRYSKDVLLSIFIYSLSTLMEDQKCLAEEIRNARSLRIIDLTIFHVSSQKADFSDIQFDLSCHSNLNWLCLNFLQGVKVKLSNVCKLQYVCLEGLSPSVFDGILRVLKLQKDLIHIEVDLFGQDRIVQHTKHFEINLDSCQKLRILKLTSMKIAEIKLSEMARLDTVHFNGLAIMSPELFQQFFNNAQMQNLTDLKLFSITGIEECVTYLYCKKLKKLEVSRLTVGGIKLPSDNELSKLKVYDVTMTDTACWGPLLQSQNLTWLNLTNIRGIEECVLDINSKKLETLEVSWLTVAGIKLPSDNELSRLTMDDVTVTDTACLGPLLQSQNLTELELTNIRGNEECVLDINSKKLEILKVSRLAVAGVKLPSDNELSNMTVNDVTMTDTACWGPLLQSQNLTELELTNIRGIEECVLDINSKKLKTLEVSRLTVARIKLPSDNELSSLTMDDVTMTDTACLGPLLQSQNLTELELTNIRGIEECVLDINSKKLKTLEVSRLTVARIKLPSDNELSSLTMDDVTMTDTACLGPLLQSQNLTELELTNIRGIEECVLDINSKKLKTLEVSRLTVARIKLPSDNELSSLTMDVVTVTDTACLGPLLQSQNLTELELTNIRGIEECVLDINSKKLKTLEVSRLTVARIKLPSDNELSSLKVYDVTLTDTACLGPLLQSQNLTLLYLINIRGIEEWVLDINSKKLKTLKVSMLTVAGIKLPSDNELSRLTMDDVTVTDTACLGPLLQSQNLTELELTNIRGNEECVLDINSKKLEILKVSRLAVAGVKLPSDNELSNMTVNDVTMTDTACWGPLLQSQNLTELELTNIRGIEECVLDINSKKLKTLEVSRLTVARIKLPSDNELSSLTMDDVTMTDTACLGPLLQSQNLTELELTNIRGIEECVLDINSKKLKTLEVSRLTVARIKLPSDNELSSLTMDDVTMTDTACLGPLLQSQNLTELELTNIRGIEECVLDINSKKLKTLEVSRLTVARIKLPSDNELSSLTMDVVTVTDTACLGPLLQSQNLTELELTNIRGIEECVLDINSKKLKTLEVSRLTVARIKLPSDNELSSLKVYDVTLTDTACLGPLLQSQNLTLLYLINIRGIEEWVLDINSKKLKTLKVSMLTVAGIKLPSDNELSSLKVYDVTLTDTACLGPLLQSQNLTLLFLTNIRGIEECVLDINSKKLKTLKVSMLTVAGIKLPSDNELSSLTVNDVTITDKSYWVPFLQPLITQELSKLNLSHIDIGDCDLVWGALDKRVIQNTYMNNILFSNVKMSKNSCESLFARLNELYTSDIKKGYKLFKKSDHLSESVVEVAVKENYEGTDNEDYEGTDDEGLPWIL